MFIDANTITAIIKKYEAISFSMSLTDARRSWADKVVRDLEGLIDDEATRQEAAMDKMVEDYEDEEYGKLECEDAAIERQLSVQNWPGGI